MYGKWESSGWYTTLNNTHLQPSDPIPCPAKDDINTIDNNQKFAKCGHYIKERSKISISICTTVGHIITKRETDLLQKAEFSPSSWLRQRSTDEIIEKNKFIRGKCKQFISAIPWKVYELYDHRSKQRTTKQLINFEYETTLTLPQNESKSNICTIYAL